jgi:hypothetical protein
VPNETEWKASSMSNMFFDNEEMLVFAGPVAMIISSQK